VLISLLPALVKMLKMNLSIHTIDLLARYGGTLAFPKVGHSLFETNKLRPRLLLHPKNSPNCVYRAKVLDGRFCLPATTQIDFDALSGMRKLLFRRPHCDNYAGYEPANAC
jgi:hypothetical protein